MKHLFTLFGKAAFTFSFLSTGLSLHAQPIRDALPTYSNNVSGTRAGFTSSIIHSPITTFVYGQNNQTGYIQRLAAVTSTMVYGVNSLNRNPFSNYSFVRITRLDATKINNMLELVWDVAGEHEISRYEIERSTNGIDFTGIGEVAALNNSAYRFVDDQPFKGASFYRIRSVDADGSMRYSSILQINAGSQSNSMQLYPNPVRNTQATLTHGELAANTRFSIISADGRVIKTIVPNRGMYNTTINLSELTPGYYVLRREDGSGYFETTSFIKQ